MKHAMFMILAIITTHAFGQNCQTGTIQATTPTTQFVDMGNGSVLDLQTGLIWAQCSVGQIYRDGQCLGEANDYASEYDALNEVSKLYGSYLGQSGFRMPNVKELASIIERQCSSPSINLTVFPDTPNATYFTNTPYPESPDSSILRTINFTFGEEFTPITQNLRHVRLVRSP